EHLRDLRPVWLVGGRIEEKLYRAEESIALEGRKDCAASGGGLPRRVGVERLGVLSREPRQEADRGAARNRVEQDPAQFTRARRHFFRRQDTNHPRRVPGIRGVPNGPGGLRIRVPTRRATDEAHSDRDRLSG